MGAILRKHGTATTVTIPMIKAGVTDFAVTGDWTPATGDVKVSKDDGNVANVGTLPVAVGGAGSALWKFTLSAAEMSAARVVIQVIDAATKAVEDQSIVIDTYGNASGQHAFDFNLAEQLVALSTTGKSDVNAEIVDVITVDTIAELSQAQPSATPTVATALQLLYMALRNKETSSTTALSIRNNAGTVITKAALSDDGSIFTRDKLITGP